jgi:hypothetical protein
VLFAPWIRDKFFPDPGWINLSTIKTFSWNHKEQEKRYFVFSFFRVGSGIKKMFGSGIKHPGSATLWETVSFLYVSIYMWQRLVIYENTIFCHF